MDSIIKIFYQEALDLLDDLDLLLLDVEENPDSSELIEQFMGKAHTFKGSSATVGLMEMSDLAHKIEDVTDLLRSDRIGPTPSLFDLLSQGIEVLRRGVGGLNEDPDGFPEVTQMKALIESWLRNATGTSSEDSKAPETVASDLELGEYDLVRIASLQEKGTPVYRIDLVLASPKEDPVKRAEEALNEARRTGEVILTQPPEWEFDAIAEVGKLKILLADDTEADEISRRLAPLADGPPRMRLFNPRTGKTTSPTASVPKTMVSERTVRVETGELEELLRLVGELVTTKARFQTIAGEFRHLLGDSGRGLDIEESAARLGQIASDLQGGIMRARMVPVTRLFRSLKRQVRTSARELRDTSVRLVTSGEDTEIDKGVADCLVEPLVQLIDLLVASARDAIDREPVVIRIAAVGTGNLVRIDLEGDGLVPAEEPLETIVAELAVSGWRFDRRAADNSFRCAIVVPTTEAIVSVMMVEAGGEVFAIPIEEIEETLRIESADVETVSGKKVTELRGRPLSIVFLAEMLEIPSPMQWQRAFTVVAKNGRAPVGILVDRLLGKQNIVIKPLGRRFREVGNVAGSAILGDGRVALVLNTKAMLLENVAQAV